MHYSLKPVINNLLSNFGWIESATTIDVITRSPSPSVFTTATVNGGSAGITVIGDFPKNIDTTYRK